VICSRRTSRWILLGAATVAGAALVARFTASRGEAFWILFPLVALLGSRGLCLFPPPRLVTHSKFARVSVPILLVLFPAGLYVGLAVALGGRIAPFELAITILFFAVSLETFLCYVFQCAEWLTLKAQRLRYRVRPLVAAITIKLCVYAVLIPFLLAVFALHRVKIPPTKASADLVGVHESVSFPSRGEPPLTLRGWFFPRKKSIGTVLACHGVGANRGDILHIVDALRRSGFQVLAFDFRGHGESDGHTVTYGYFEKDDVLGAWDYLRSRPDVDRSSLLAFGVSMGGSAMLLALAELEGVRAAVVDSPFADLESMALHQYRFFPGPLAQAFAKATAFFGWVETGIRLSEVSPIRALERTHVPILFIHGTGDSIVPVENSRRLFEAYTGPKKLWIEPGAGHGGTILEALGQYKTAVREFFEHSG
jgi:alpha-beta hydrolase superfamily lysophospholipase